ncbi:MAG: hypothetical protein GY725_00815 [bacterium]|nr:hypothetical protein [bacterium]
MDAATAVLFAIRTGVRLGIQAQRAYVDSARGRELVLPLPNFNPVRNSASAQVFFSNRDVALLEPARLQELAGRLGDAGPPLNQDEKQELVDFHTDALLLQWSETEADRGSGPYPDRDGMLALVTVRQWERETEPHPSVAQRIAGTMIETGIDYFTNVPGAIDPGSKGGKIVTAVLRGFDDIEFSEVPLGDLPQRMLLGALESLGEESALLSSDPKVQQLITTLTTSLVKDVEAHIEAIRAAEGANTFKEGRVRAWAEVVFRSVVSSGGRLVVENPKEYLGVSGAGEQALVSNVGSALLGLIVDSPEGELDALFSTSSLEVLADAALRTLGEHPEILVKGGNDGLRTLLGQVATELADYDRLFQTSMLPEIGRMVLDKTGENLPLLWPELANDPKKNLLLTGASTALDVLTREPAAGERWQPRFGREELLDVTEAVLDQFVENPGWLVDQAGEVNENLKVALEAAVGVIRKRGDQRLGTALATDILKSSVAAVATRQEFIQELPGDAQVAVAAVLDVVLDQVFRGDLDPKAAWVLTRGEVVRGLVSVALDELGRTQLGEGEIAKLRQVLKQHTAAIANGQAFDLSAFATELETELAS